MWTDDQTAKLRELTPTGQSAAEIARILAKEFGFRFTRNMVLSKLLRLGVKLKNAKTDDAWKRPTRADPARPPRLPGRPKTLLIPKHLKSNAPDIALRPEPPVPTSAITIHELSMGKCHWPLGDPRTPEFRYCGMPTLTPPMRQTKYYCEHHHQIAWVPAPKRVRSTHAS